MKYDDASWHYGGQFPKGSPDEYGATHIGLYLKWCILRNLISDFQKEESKDDIEKVIAEKMSGTEFLLKNCDEKFTDEDLIDLGNKFTEKYYEKDYMKDYTKMFDDKMYVVSENEHDFTLLAKHLDKKFKEFESPKPWWKFWK